MKYLDSPLYNYLLNLYKRKYLQESAVFFVSDHGLHFPNIFNLLLSEDTNIEKNNGLLFILLSNSNNSNINYYSIYENMRENSQSMITPYDIYFTFLNIIEETEIKIYNDNYIRIGTSLFKKIKRKTRNCKKYKELKGKTCI